MKTKALLAAIAATELVAGIGLLLVPSVVAELLVGQPLGAGASLVVGRVAGTALIAIGLVCWLEIMRPRAGSPTGLLIGLLAYNVVVPLLLVHSYIANQTSGIGTWPTVALHLAFALWIVACLRLHSAARSG
jgi:hypothetical protein